MTENSTGCSSSPDGSKAIERTVIARLGRGTNMSNGRDPEFSSEVQDTADRSIRVVMEVANLHQK